MDPSAIGLAVAGEIEFIYRVFCAAADQVIDIIDTKIINFILFLFILFSYIR